MRIGTFETAMTAGQRALRAAAAALPLAFAAPGSAAAQDSEEVLYSIPDELFKTPIQESEARVLDWLRSNPDLPDSVLDGVNNTFMHYAATNLSSILREAVRRGGDCNRRNAHGATPLHFAAVQDGLGPGPEALRILVRCEAAPNVEPMCAAGERTAEDCRADPNARDRLGRTPLHSLYEGVEPGGFPIRNLRSRWGVPRDDVARVLLEELGADPNVKDNNGDAPLMLVVRTVDRVVFSTLGHASLLLSHDADPNTRNDKGATPLIEIVSSFSALSEDYTKTSRLIRLLIGRGADPDLRDGRSGDTPLIRAAKHEDDSVYEIEALLAGGADPCLRDRNGRLAYDHAREEGALALYKAGGYPDPINGTGLCVRDLRMAEEREKKLALDRGARRELQSCLKTLGFDPGEPDGLFGSRTRRAVRAWQASEGREGVEAAGFFSRDDADALLDGACAAAAQKEFVREENLRKKDLAIYMKMFWNDPLLRFSSFDDLDPDIIFQYRDQGEYNLYRIDDNLDHDFNKIVWSRTSTPSTVQYVCGPLNIDEPEKALQYYKKQSKRIKDEEYNSFSVDLELWRWRTSLLSEKMVKEVMREEAILFTYINSVFSCNNQYDHHFDRCGCFDNWESTLNWMKEGVDSR